jgi:hypothetical protein
MMQPVSRPVAPLPPNKEVYSVQDLALFRSYTRESYRAAFGVEAPAFDPSRLVKTWFDSTADVSQPDNVSVYRVVARDANGNWAVRQLVIPAAEAAAVNLPGRIAYPAYVVRPTNATRTGPGGLVPQPLNPDYLSSMDDAQRMMAEVGGSAVVEEFPLGGGFGTYFPAEEDRRLWEVVVKGRRINAGFLLKDRNSGGVGAPGQWDLSGEVPAWMPAPAGPSGVDDTRPLREIPVRDLLPFEQLQPTLMGASVIRTDLRQEAGKILGQFTPEDRALLVAIYNALVAE